MRIRQAGMSDRDAIRGLYLEAFPDEEREVVAAVAVDLLDEQTVPETVAFVADDGGTVVGHIGFSPVSCSVGEEFRGYLLAPLAVHPHKQKQRIGSTLVEAGIQYVASLDSEMVFVYGDPEFYGRFGFDAGTASGYVPPYELEYPFGWQAKRLVAGGASERPGKLSCVRTLQSPQLW